jgi:hypothetical protein
MKACTGLALRAVGRGSACRHAHAHAPRIAPQIALPIAPQIASPIELQIALPIAPQIAPRIAPSAELCSPHHPAAALERIHA